MQIHVRICDIAANVDGSHFEVCSAVKYVLTRSLIVGALKEKRKTAANGKRRHAVRGCHSVRWEFVLFVWCRFRFDDP